jgi:DNA-binding Lrp family transcriptional regulator
MYKAYILLKVAPQQEDRILRELSKFPSISESHKIFGMFDLVVEIEQKGMRDIMQAVAKIRAIKGVQDTITNLVADFDMDVHGAPL